MMLRMMTLMMVLMMPRFGHHLLHHFFPAVDISKLEYLYPALQVHIEDNVIVVNVTDRQIHNDLLKTDVSNLSIMMLMVIVMIKVLKLLNHCPGNFGGAGREVSLHPCHRSYEVMLKRLLSGYVDENADLISDYEEFNVEMIKN